MTSWGACDQPWRRLPEVALPVTLEPSDVAIDRIDLPRGSSVTAARILKSGRVVAARWRGTGDTPFYPASTVKWVTAMMTLSFMAREQLRPDDVLELEGEEARSFRQLLGDMLVHSDNHAFNLLQETVGFAETWQQMQAWGCQHAIIRRHFTRPHYSHSRRATVRRVNGEILSLPARPDPVLPLNQDDRQPPLGNREQNLATTDDLVRIMAATLAGPTRYLPGFDAAASHLLVSGHSGVRAGLARVTATELDRPPFVVLSKPGWWPPDGATAEMSYIYDVRQDAHLLLAVYIQGDRRRGQTLTRRVAERLLPLLRRL